MRNIKILSVLVFGIALLMGCSDDYLDTKPTSQISTPTIFETTDNAKLAINGINKLMTRQYLGSQGFNGEGTIKMYYGNYPGKHFSVNLPGWAPIINSDYFDNNSSIYDYYPWYYYYMLIGNANTIIENIDNASGLNVEKDFIKAQALTYRAYCFFMLSQIYSHRWKDTNGGNDKGVLLRIDSSDGDMPLSTLKETYERIYTDLDDAIRLYKSSGLERDNNYDPDINVAYAIYARAAITREDYPTALSMAKLARKDFPLMSVNEYKAGFSKPTSEWIWSSYGGSDETLYFYSYFAYIAYNSSASAVRSYPKLISKELYNKIPETDIRRNLFLDPKGDPYTVATGVAGADLKARAFSLFPKLDAAATIYAYMQFKILAQDLPGVGHLNHFRSSEMYLIEAEANYFLNDEDAARESLEDLTKGSGRDADYATTNAGADLLEEIKTYRAIELWGEGFDWFDLKRWGDGMSRTGTNDGGNFVTVLAVSYGPNDKSQWTWAIPLKETDYNDEINK